MWAAVQSAQLWLSTLLTLPNPLPQYTHPLGEGLWSQQSYLGGGWGGAARAGENQIAPQTTAPR